MGTPAPGDTYYAKFDDEDLWHQRLCLALSARGAVVVTPDGDVYEEK